MGSHQAKQERVVNASVEQCYAAITDFESYPDWQSSCLSCEIVKKHKSGDAHHVELTVDIKVKEISYTLAYEHDEPNRLSWDLVEGDAKAIDGEYVFEDLGDGTTKATYSLDVDPGMFVPGPIKRKLSEQMMSRSIEELKDRAESLAAS